jgi:hypothetical protein
MSTVCQDPPTSAAADFGLLIVKAASCISTAAASNSSNAAGVASVFVISDGCGPIHPGGLLLDVVEPTLPSNYEWILHLCMPSRRFSRRAALALLQARECIALDQLAYSNAAGAQGSSPGKRMHAAGSKDDRNSLTKWFLIQMCMRTHRQPARTCQPFEYVFNIAAVLL